MSVQGSYYSYSSYTNAPLRTQSINLWGQKATISYDVKSKSRAIAAQNCVGSKCRFFVGTTNLTENNSVHYIDVSQDKVTPLCVWEHKHEIWGISPCTIDPDIFFTIYNQEGNYQASLWKIEDKGLSELSLLKGETKSLKCILWRPKKHKITDSSVIAIDSGCISCWDLNTWKESYKLSAGELGIFTTGVWDPHNPDLVMSANGSTISSSDLRQPTPAFTIPSAHGERSLIRDMDYNPNKLNFFASCGDDSKIKFWDQRKTSSPVKVFSTHSHWVWKVQFHPYFDSLAISSSSDKSVCLWDVRSVSRENTKRSHGRPAKLVKSYQSHDESVYSVCWSGCDINELSGGNVFDWNIFASVAYDGRVIISRVPHDKTTAVIAGR